MPVVGAVLELFSGAPVPDALLSDPRVALGERAGDRVPLVLTTDTRDEDRALLESVRDLPGVVDARVAFAWFADLSDSEPAPSEVTP